MKKIANKLGFEHHSFLDYYYPEDRKQGNLEVFSKVFENDKTSFNNKTSYEKELYFRGLKNNSIIFNMQFKQNEIVEEKEQVL